MYSGSMKGLKTILMLFLLFLTPVSPIATPLRAPGNNTSLNLLLPTDASNLTSPFPPKGYGLLLKFDEYILLNVLAVYINAIELMYRLAQEDWDALIHTNIQMSVTTYNIWIIATRAPAARLQIGHIVIALQDSVVAMARLTDFYRLTALITLDGVTAGYLDFGNNQSPMDGNNTSSGVPKDDLLLINNNTDQSGSSVSNSGQVIDPYDPKFVITYQFFDQSIDSKEIFTVVLDGLATCAQFKPSDEYPVLEAYSVSGTTAISISKVLGRPTRLHYSDMTRSLLLIVTKVIVMERKFKELEFNIGYDGVRIAEGFMFKVTSANNGTQERLIAAEK